MEELETECENVMDSKVEEARMKYLGSVESAARMIEGVAFDHARDLGMAQVAKLIEIAAELDRVVNESARASPTPMSRRPAARIH